MKIKLGKATVRCGKEAYIFTIKARGEYPVVGLVRYDSSDEPCSWTLDGKFNKEKEGLSTDIISQEVA